MPGARLREVELASRYGVSRIPLREALRRLEAEGLIASSPNRGVTVRALERDDIDELFAFRLALERLAVRSAAARSVDLRADVRARREAVRSADGAARMIEVISEDRAFHADLACASGNRHVVDALGGRWAHISRVMHIYLTALEYPEGVWDEHAAIVDAVADGDADRADALLTDHILRSRKIVLGLMPR